MVYPNHIEQGVFSWIGAYYSSGSKNVSAHAWAAGRVRSFATGKGGARKADKDLLRSKRKKGLVS